MGSRDEDFERVAEAQRTTEAAATREGIGTPDPGTELPARAYPDETGVTDFGVEEPVPPVPEADTDPDPTGMFASEREADRREEDAVRRVLEEGFSRDAGHVERRRPGPERRDQRPPDRRPAGRAGAS